MDGNIFINYRRGEDQAAAGRLHDQLESVFGRSRIFIDVDGILPGKDFAKELSDRVAECEIFLAIIGKNWINIRDDEDRIRINNAHDWVRIEIESALRQAKFIIPILIGGAEMPKSDQLPPTIAPLASRNAVRLTHERFKADVQGLIEALQALGAEPPRFRAIRPFSVVLSLFACAVTLLGVGSWLWWPDRGNRTAIPPTSLFDQPHSKAANASYPQQERISPAISSDPEAVLSPSTKTLTVAVNLGSPKSAADAPRLGVLAEPVDKQWIATLGLASPDGVVLTGVAPDSPASRAGLRLGDVVQTIDGTPVARLDHVRRLIASSKSGQVLSLKMVRPAVDAVDVFAWFRERAKMGFPAAAFAIGNQLSLTGDDANAREWFEKAAGGGFPAGMRALGEAFANARGVPRDYIQAMSWYLKAADEGDAAAQNDLGDLYFNGRGVVQNYVQALAWYRKAAEAELAVAQNSIGLIYERGSGVTQDYSQALHWYQKAADQGNTWAQNNIGVMYQKGYSVKQDYSQAINWLKKAANQGNSLAQYNLAVLYTYDEAGVKDISQAINWYRKSADQGNADAQIALGWTYQYGRWGSQQDFAQALIWYRKAADQGNARAQDTVGLFYSNGWSVQIDDTQAAMWIKKSADQGFSKAEVDLGSFYFSGRGVQKDISQAYYWFRRAAEHNSPDAANRLGICFEHGWGVHKNYAKAMKWYIRATDLGDRNAFENIGKLYEHGLGVKKDIGKAKFWYQKAVENGDEDAKNLLKRVMKL